MTCRFLKKTYIRMRGREETRESCSQGVHSWDMPAKCGSCSMREEDHALACAVCGRPMPDGRAQAWIGGLPYCEECVKDLLGIPEGGSE